MEYDDPFGKDPDQYVAKLLEKMNELGAVRLEAYYSGGNDQGGIEELQVLIDEDGKSIEPPPQFAETDEKWPNGNPKVIYDPTGFWQSANDILSTRYGSWAGDFEAYGTLYVDVKEGRAWVQGTEGVTHYEEIDPIEVKF